MLRGPFYVDRLSAATIGPRDVPAPLRLAEEGVRRRAGRRRVNDDARSVFTGDDAIARFGVGKNMVGRDAPLGHGCRRSYH